ncbi:MAG: hypothetical protein IJF92_01240 [Bacilli bacterium]|nr:hypothetical protein [Bacilli bacterium]
MDIKFNSQEELFTRVKPALNAKLQELHRLGFSYVTINDIWNYLVENNWKNGKDLTLSDIVSNIIHVDNNKLDEYIKGKITKKRRSEDYKEDLI